jgi:hypothetical protein
MATLTFKSLGRYGRFGNQLFQVAATIGIAKKHGYDFAFPKWHNYDALERFGTQEPIDIYNYLKNPLPEITDFDGFLDHFVHWGYHETHLPARNWNLSGHMQSERYWDHCEGEVRHYLTFKEPYEQIPAIALHVRLGDYGGDYHPRQPMSYYRQALAMLPDMEVIVFSDSPDEAEKLFPDAIVSGGNDYIEDFKLMTACHSFVIANSTYSWWAAYLGSQQGKQVIAPALWFGPAAGLDPKDIYCKGWKVI